MDWKRDLGKWKIVLKFAVYASLKTVYFCYSEVGY